MTSRDFAYWLQGFFEITDAKNITEQQTAVIKNHLNLVFKHEIDPSIDGGDKLKQEEYQNIHDGPINFISPGISAGVSGSSNTPILRC